MKNIVKNIFGFFGIIAMVLCGAENPDGSMNFCWFVSCAAISAFFFWLYFVLDRKHEKR